MYDACIEIYVITHTSENSVANMSYCPCLKPALNVMDLCLRSLSMEIVGPAKRTLLDSSYSARNVQCSIYMRQSENAQLDLYCGSEQSDDYCTCHSHVDQHALCFIDDLVVIIGYHNLIDRGDVL